MQTLALDLAGARVVVTGRAGGVSLPPYDQANLASHVGDDPIAVRQNRARLAAAIGAGPVTFMQQVHGRDVHAVTSDSPTEIEAVDALVTQLAGRPLAVLVADCVPVAVIGARAIGVAHAGRRGVAEGVVAATVAALRNLDEGQLRAVIGPAVCGRCYEVPEQMQREVVAIAPAADATTRSGTPALDLPAAVEASLRSLGIDSIERSTVCTREDERFYSHRRDGVTGRFALVALRR